MEEKDSEENFCANLRKALGIKLQTEMAQRLEVPFARWNMAEVRSKGRISIPLLRRVVRTFGWTKVAPLLRKELEAPEEKK
jgi:hypothetical protein